MTREPYRVAAFRGGVSCRRELAGALTLTLVGRTWDHPEEKVSLAFSGGSPEEFPEVLEDPTVDQVGPGRYRIVSAPREWMIDARAVHVHREIATAFYGAIPPRRVPWTKRLFWGLVLGLAGSSWGKRVLLALRG